MSALTVRWLVHELKVVGTLIDSTETAEKSRVAAIKIDAAEKYEACYQHFVYIKENRTLLSVNALNNLINDYLSRKIERESSIGSCEGLLNCSEEYWW